MTATVTFMLTDIEGSSRLWNEDPPRMRTALALHDDLVTASVETHGGDVLTNHGEGDSFFAVFPRAGDAVAAAVTMQRGLASQRWPGGTPLLVRAAIHSGEAGPPDYRGPTANRCARFRACAHGGQVLLSSSTVQIAGPLPPGITLLDLGEHRLRDMSRLERIHQLRIEGLRERFPPIRSLGAFSHNLPIQLTSFVGRTREAKEVRSLLSLSRLVTLTGPGGCGKSRLALQFAADEAEAYPGGVWFVGLAGLTDADLVVQSVASVLGAREEPGQRLIDTLGAKLREKPMLLLLDNCEHLVDACGGIVGHLLATCPELRILVTSREILNVHGELAWRVPSLQLPELDGPRNPRQLLKIEAVALFVDRASSARPGYTLDTANADTIAQICVRLEGIPLAIEIAAARLRTVSAAEILERLRDRFRVLTGGSRSGLSRHQTLRAAIDWSYELLDEPERTLFQRLAIFSGGWTLDEAEQVCSDEALPAATVLDVLGRLIDKSLVVMADGRLGTRYSMLDTLRDYGRERLAHGGGDRSLNQRHLSYFLALAESMDPALGATQDPDSLGRLADAHANLLAALNAARDVDHPSFARLAAALRWFWHADARFGEGSYWLSEARRLWRTPDGTRGLILRGLASIAWQRADYASAESLLYETIAIFEMLGDEVGAARSFTNLGLVAYNQGQFERALESYHAALVVVRRHGNAQAVAVALSNLGLCETDAGKLEGGRRHLEAALDILRELDDRVRLPQSLIGSGVNALCRADYQAAYAFIAEGLQLADPAHDALVIVDGLEGMALLAAASGRAAAAVRLVASAAAQRERLDSPLPPVSEARYRSFVAPVRLTLDPAADAEAWAAGTGLTIEDAVWQALHALDPDVGLRAG